MRKGIVIIIAAAIIVLVSMSLFGYGYRNGYGRGGGGYCRRTYNADYQGCYYYGNYNNQIIK